eukprot:TRINITY_DN5336_c0_g1_i1.p1 TRINITY_DN5336_c0_g1~~TRINITY_DN5336_c0_g1_i1.p1  ORF type:complete len:631 (-),score=120.18 TRINITY_DN5336_c0_g1_i1:36-1928(-)
MSRCGGDARTLNTTKKAIQTGEVAFVPLSENAETVKDDPEAVEAAVTAEASVNEEEDANNEQESEQDGNAFLGIPARRSGRGSGRRRRVGGPFKVNTAACTGKSAKDLYSAVVADLGWREVDVDPRRSDSGATSLPRTIYCVTQSNDLLERLPLKASSWVTRYVALPDMCDKGNLARMYQYCEDLAEEGTYGFNPPTWILPEQLDELRVKLAKSTKTFIVKPEDGSQGDGIFLVQGVRDLDIKLSVKANKAGVAQKYLDKPLLYRGFKFDFRVYVALVGGSCEAPPRVYLCREGLARFCTEEYHEPSQTNMHKCMSHLTNYSLNKRSLLFEHSGETYDEVFSLTTTASKRPLSVALQQIAQEHANFDIEIFYESLAGLIRSTVSLMAPVLLSAGRDLHDGAELRSCQVLGFDVMLDRRFVPYLLEVNNSPSLCIDEALPLDPEEAEEWAAAMKEKGATRAVNKTKDGAKVCRCMDMSQPHRHQTAMVDLVVKKTVMRSLFEILGQLSGGVAEPHSEACIFVDVGEDEIYDLLSRIEAIFSQRGGGAAKGFTGASLRRVFGPLCGRGNLEKHDLDAFGQRRRHSRFITRDMSGNPDALRLFDYLDLFKQIATRAFPGQPVRDALEQALALL